MIGKTNAIGGVSDPVPKIRTVSGSVISISNALALPAVSLAVDIDPVQDLHGYDHPWPAGGGKNLFNKDDNNSIVAGYIASSAFSTSNTKARTVYVPISPSTTYTVSKNAGARFQVATSPNAPANGVAFTARQNNPIGTSITITSGASDVYLWAWVYLEDTDTGTLNDMLATVQVEAGSTATSYAPYANICPITGWSNVNVYREAQYDAGATPYVTINLNGTRYGGSLDVVSGVLTVTHGIVDATTIGWVKFGTQNNPNGTYYLLSNTSVPFLGWGSGGSNSAKCNALAKSDTGAGTSSSANTFWWNNASNGWRAIWGIANGGSTLAEFAQFLSDNNVVFYGELATPQTVQLSPTTVQMLLGNNTIWSDSGDTELQYWARR